MQSSTFTTVVILRHALIILMLIERSRFRQSSYENKSGWNPTLSCDGAVTKGSALKLMH